jgi:hypothetical protein
MSQYGMIVFSPAPADPMRLSSEHLATLEAYPEQAKALKGKVLGGSYFGKQRGFAFDSSTTAMTVEGDNQNPGILKIEALNKIEAYDSVRIESVSGFGVSVGISRVESDTLAAINLIGGSLESRSRFGRGGESSEELIKLVRRDEKGVVQWHYILFEYLCRYISGEPHASDDAVDVASASPDHNPVTEEDLIPPSRRARWNVR